MADRKTPGVYIVEENAFPNSVVEVATAVPAFIGVTEKALRGNQDLTGVPTRISSMAEFVTLFGGPPNSQLTYASPSPAKAAVAATAAVPGVDGKPDTPAIPASPATPAGTTFTVSIVASTHYRFYSSMQIFFDNGGGPCWIISVGSYASVTAAGGMNAIPIATICTNPLQELLKQQEPTMIVVPDAVMMPFANWVVMSQQAVAHCVATQSRVAIIDVFGGDQPRTYDAAKDVISGTDAGFRNKITLDPDSRRYAAAYYPWLATSVWDASTINYSYLDTASKTALVADLTKEAQGTYPQYTDNTTTDYTKYTALVVIINKIAAAAPSDAVAAANTLTSTHLALNNISPLYQAVLLEIQSKLNVLPPAAAMAGVYTRIDDSRGVFKAPANVGINSAVNPLVDITDADQEDLNVPIDGMAINAIRNFNGRGMLIWGARTLDGNSQDWRYINVRRTMIMLEQSIKLAAQAYVFEPNNSQTWVMVKSMLSSFLSDRWKEGALVGAKMEDAFSVDVGLGSTMTGNDILNGYMFVMVKVCLVRPAEFIVITFQQLMQKS